MKPTLHQVLSMRTRNVLIPTLLVYCLCDRESTAAPFTAGNIVVSNSISGSQDLLEYTITGIPVQQIPISPALGARDVVIDRAGRAQIYNGTFSPSLTTYGSVSNTFSSQTFPGWSTVNNTTYGGIGTFGRYVFVSDMETAGSGSPQGVIRFDLDGGDPVRFATDVGPIDLNVGLDGLLYTLSRGTGFNGGGNRVDVFHPETMAFIRTVNLPQEHRGIAVDFNGDIYTAQRDPVSRVNRFSPAGVLVDSINDPGVFGFGDIDINRKGGVLIASHGGSLLLTTTALDDIYFFTTRNPAGSNFAAWIEITVPEPSAWVIFVVGVGLVAGLRHVGWSSEKQAIRVISALVVVTFSVRAHGDSFGSGANMFEIEFVTIGNPGNPGDTTGFPNPAGSVPDLYRIGKFEISRDMIIKANAEGGLGITLASNVINGNGPNKPALGTSWNEAARFVNWLNTSTGNPPAYKFAFQPGQPGYNPNDGNLLWVPIEPGYDPNNLYRNKLAKYFLPSVHEWYKAAYYDPVANVYYNFATGSDTPPIPVGSGTAPGTAVYMHNQTGPADIDQAGGLSPYGTMAQNGNALDLIETEDDQLNDTPSNWRQVRGGAWYHPHHSDLESPSVHAVAIPSDEFAGLGFRIASIIPEPSTMLLGVMATAALWLRRQAFR